MLLDKTEKDGVHLNAADIIKIFKQEYAVTLDRKTIYRCVDDLCAFGFDVQKASDGYYLGERALTETDFALIADGIESAGLSTDDKVNIYDKLCRIIGKDPDTVGPHFYNTDELGFMDDGGMEALELVNTAIKQDKQLLLSPILTFLPKMLFGELTDEEKSFIDEIKNSYQFYQINPYEIVRLKNGDLCLLFYVNILGTMHPGALWVAGSSDDMILSDKKREKADVHGLFQGIHAEESKDYFSLFDDEKEETAILVPTPGHTVNYMFIVWFLEECISHRPVFVNGNDGVEFTFKHRAKTQIIMSCIENSDIFRILPGSTLFSSLIEIKSKLSDYNLTEKDRENEPGKFFIGTEDIMGRKKFLKMFCGTRAEARAEFQKAAKKYAITEETAFIDSDTAIKMHIADSDGNILDDIRSGGDDDEKNMVSEKSIVCTEKVIVADGVNAVGPGAFHDNRDIKEIELPDSTIEIAAGGFTLCKNLRSISIPNVKSVGEFAFCTCVNLESADMSHGIEEIAQRAFSGCHKLKTVRLSGNLKKIGKEAFAGCHRIENLYYDGDLASWGKIEFAGERSDPSKHAEHFFIKENGEWEEVPAPENKKPNERI
ncbi:MAG: leucine-rich repeat domain-containing protein [Clostridiales bacterium]|nr:leucine-rich repeat domain-containing protein [Clostridiales bacterium]